VVRVTGGSTQGKKGTVQPAHQLYCHDLQLPCHCSTPCVSDTQWAAGQLQCGMRMQVQPASTALLHGAASIRLAGGSSSSSGGGRRQQQPTMKALVTFMASSMRPLGL